MFEYFLTNKNNWLSAKGPESEIVFSSRVRLARNLEGFLFASKASSAQKKEILSKMQSIYKDIEKLKGSAFVKRGDISDIDGQFLLERHLVSRELIAESKNNKGIIISNDERISIMVNEEDHLRMQVMASGFDLKNCWRILNEIDNDLSRKVKFSFSSDLGYLTACPTNVGTGFRASCMLHLPALVFTKRINKILELLARISFTTRGLFGEGTQALGNFFQISNQVSLGLSEEELIDNLIGVVNQIKDQEIDARDTLVKKFKLNLEDNIWRALGLLRNSRLITTKEALGHLSTLSLGLDLGIIKGSDFSVSEDGKGLINSLFIIIQPAHLQKIESKSLKGAQRDYVRSEILRKKLGGKDV